MTLKELQDESEKLVHDAREALDEITNNADGSRAEELEARHDTIMGEFDKLEVRIAREQRTSPSEGRSVSRSGLNYRTAFYSYLASGANLAELSAEERAVLKAGVVENRVQTTLSNSAGNYTVPVELADQIIKSMAAWGPMYDKDVATTINTSSGALINLPTVDDTGSTAEKHTEGTALTDDGGKDVTLGSKQLGAYVFDTEWIRFSFELAQDSILGMETLLGDLLGERLGRLANRELTIGDGVDDPNGIVTASSQGIAAAGAGTITPDEIVDLLHSVDPAYRQGPKVRFMFNDLTLAAIRKLKDGDGKYIWTMGDIRNGVPGTLLGHPYSINQAMAGIASGNRSMIFGDFGKYFVRKVASPVIGVKREAYWPDLGIAGLIRFDGELGDTAAVKHLIQA